MTVVASPEARMSLKRVFVAFNAHIPHKFFSANVAECDALGEVLT